MRTAASRHPGEVSAPLSNQEGAEAHPPQATASTSFWSSLNPFEQHRFRSLADERIFAGGARLMQEREKANYVIVILSGRVKICVNESGAERVIAERGPGQLVGERAILQVNVRSATVVALEMVHALVMKTADFALFVSTHPAVLNVVEGQIYKRLTESPVLYEISHVPFAQDGFVDHLMDPRFGAPASGHPPPLHGENCTIIFTDVVAFGSPERSDEHRRIIRQEILRMTAASLRPIWSQCSYEDRGDGLLIVVRPGIPTAQVLEYLLVALPIALKRHNSIYGTGSRIQLRVALDVGPVTGDDLGVSGQVIINAARLLEALDLEGLCGCQPRQPGIVFLRLHLSIGHPARRRPERPRRLHGNRGHSVKGGHPARLDANG